MSGAGNWPEPELRRARSSVDLIVVARIWYLSLSAELHHTPAQSRRQNL